MALWRRNPPATVAPVVGELRWMDGRCYVEASAVANWLESVGLDAGPFRKALAAQSRSHHTAWPARPHFDDTQAQFLDPVAQGITAHAR